MALRGLILNFSKTSTSYSVTSGCIEKRKFFERTWADIQVQRGEDLICDIENGQRKWISVFFSLWISDSEIWANIKKFSSLIFPSRSDFWTTIASFLVHKAVSLRCSRLVYKAIVLRDRSGILWNGDTLSRINVYLMIITNCNFNQLCQ